MSYDVEVATHTRPDGLEAPDGGTVDGPVAAEPDDLAEALAAAVLAPRWLTTLSIPYDASQRRRDALRSLARRLAQEHEGAAYDPQEDAVFFPRGRPKRVPAGKAEKTSIVGLAWYVDAERWAAGAGRAADSDRAPLPGGTADPLRRLRAAPGAL